MKENTVKTAIELFVEDFLLKQQEAKSSRFRQSFPKHKIPKDCIVKNINMVVVNFFLKSGNSYSSGPYDHVWRTLVVVKFPTNTSPVGHFRFITEYGSWYNGKKKFILHRYCDSSIVVPMDSIESIEFFPIKKIHLLSRI